MSAPWLVPGAVAAALAVSGAATRVLLALRLPDALLDRPNERSLHERPTPRCGGLAILAGAAAGLGVLAASGALPARTTGLFAGAVLIAAVSLADDLGGLRPGLRLLSHFAAAALLLPEYGTVLGTLPLPGVVIHPGVTASRIVVLLFVVWMVNLYNFMDGMDGFAGGMAVCGFGAVGLLAALHGGGAPGAIALVAAAAAAGFLPSNFPPARIFMGDTGSATLGFLAAGVLLMNSEAGGVPFWMGVLVFSPFIVDATVTLVRRALRGERVWLAHRDHYYQRLVRVGWGHRRTVLAEYCVMLAAALSVAVALDAGPALQVGIASCWVFAYVLLALAVERLTLQRAGRCTG